MTKKNMILTATFVILLLAAVSFSQVERTDKQEQQNQTSSEAVIGTDNFQQTISLPDYKNDRKNQIKKAFPNESLEEMIRRSFKKGTVEVSDGEDAFNLGSKSFNWVFITYRDGSRWDLGIYEFDDYFWFYVRDFYNSEGIRVYPTEAAPPGEFLQNNDTSIENPDKSPGFLEVLGTTTTCAGVSSYNNPYNCCWNDPNKKVLANCTFMAWESARRSWGFGPSSSSWGNANQWKTKASSAGYPVSSKVKLYSIAQHSNGTFGHVALVTGLDSSGKIIVDEQNCGESFTRYGRVYGSNPFSAYIQKKNGQNIYIGGVQSGIYASGYGQTVWFRISQNYYYNHAVKFLFTFPNGGVAMVSSGYYYNTDKIYLNLVLNARGTWKVQAFYPNGDYSNEFSFKVN